MKIGAAQDRHYGRGEGPANMKFSNNRRQSSPNTLRRRGICTDLGTDLRGKELPAKPFEHVAAKKDWHDSQ
jgi:hypothetical protein